MAAVLHDELQQLLVGARLRLSERQRVPQGRVSQTALEVKELINQSLELSRSIAGKLCPPILSAGGLIPALERLVRWVHEKLGLTVKRRPVDPRLLESEEARGLQDQAVRELLFNVALAASVCSAFASAWTCWTAAGKSTASGTGNRFAVRLPRRL